MRTACALAILSGSLLAHPMGNFSVNHYSRFELTPGKSKLLYVLDFAELPTFDLLKEWGIPLRDATAVQIRQRAEAEAPRWVAALSVKQSGARVAARMQRVSVTVNDGAGGMAVLQVRMEAEVPVSPGPVEYEDLNFAGRPGWKEIVIAGSAAATLTRATPPSGDRSRALTSYPSEMEKNAPQDTRASFDWTIGRATPASLPATPAPSRADAAPARNNTPGNLVRGDYLSRLLSRQDIGWGMILIGLAAAFGLGAMHALSPGHGKTIVAAYLVGTRGTARHALFLGGMVTFTHTISVFALGLAMLFLQQYIQAERIIPLLGAVSGASILLIGGWLLYQRAKALALDGFPVRSHHHDGHHSHEHGHSHDHNHGFVHAHSHDGVEHSHVLPKGDLSLASLIALGVSGGLVPCPSALVLMLSAIGMGRAAFGLGLLVAFSAGLALVLTAIGVAVIFAKDRLPRGLPLRSAPAARLVPVFSAVAVMVLGGLMTLSSLGWIRPLAFIA